MNKTLSNKPSSTIEINGQNIRISSAVAEIIGSENSAKAIEEILDMVKADTTLVASITAAQNRKNLDEIITHRRNPIENALTQKLIDLGARNPAIALLVGRSVTSIQDFKYDNSSKMSRTGPKKVETTRPKVETAREESERKVREAEEQARAQAQLEEDAAYWEKYIRTSR